MFGMKKLAKRVADLEAEAKEITAVMTARYAQRPEPCAVCGAVGIASRMCEAWQPYSVPLSMYCTYTEAFYVHKHCMPGSAYDRRAQPRKAGGGSSTTSCSSTTRKAKKRSASK